MKGGGNARIVGKLCVQDTPQSVGIYFEWRSSASDCDFDSEFSSHKSGGGKPSKIVADGIIRFLMWDFGFWHFPKSEIPHPKSKNTEGPCPKNSVGAFSLKK